ncbi:hypothetical protein MIMGU_mgv1a0157611mg, partial [Erythranthe guttata]
AVIATIAVIFGVTSMDN